MPISGREFRATRSAMQPEAALILGLTWVVITSLLGWLAMLTILPYQGVGIKIALMVFVLGPAVGLWLLARAGANAGSHLLVIVVAVILVSDLSFRGRAEGLDAQSAVKFAIWMSGLLLLVWRPQVLRLAQSDGPTFALLLFGLWALASTGYSISPRYTFAAALCFLGMWCTAVVVATSVDSKRSLLWVVGTLFATVMASLLMYAIAPSAAMVLYENNTTLRLGGIFGNANALGGVSALTILLMVVTWFSPLSRNQVKLSLLILPVSLACLALTQSRTAMLGLTVAVVVLIVRRKPLLLLPGLLIGASAALVVTGFDGAMDSLISLVARSGRVEQVLTFTGRTDIWAFVVSAIKESPLLGYGFASTRELITAGYAGPYGWTTTSAHNLWLQAWVTTGVVGLVIVLTSQIGQLKALVIKPSPLRDGVCVYALTVGLFESGPLGPSVNLLTFIWIWATASSLQSPNDRA